MIRLIIKVAFFTFLASSVSAEEFSSPIALEDWLQVSEQEGYASQLESLRVTQDGYLEMIPYTTTWYMEYKGPLVYREFSGDFVFTTNVRVSNRAGDGYPSSIYSLAGIMLREPQQPLAHFEDWVAGQENYVFISAGRSANVGVTAENVIAPHIEVKTTVNSVSQLEITSINATDNVELALMRAGDHIVSLFRSEGEVWRVARRFNRADFPETLQVGMMAYTNYDKVSSYSPQFQIFNTLTEQLENDPSSNPGLPFRADLVSSFDYARIRAWTVPSSWQGQNLTSSAIVSDQAIIEELLSVISEQEVVDPGNPEDETEDQQELSCQHEWPLTQAHSISAVGNSFIGNYGGICAHMSALEQQSSPLGFAASMTCDFRYGVYLRDMFDDPEGLPPLNVVSDAESGQYDYGLFISDILGDDISEVDGDKGMLAFDQLYDQNCMQSIVFMTWNFANPVRNSITSLQEYRAQISELASRMRYMEQERGARVVPYGVVLYNLSMAPPPSLSHLPIDYLYEPNGNIHDNALGVWLKVNTLYATLYQSSPEGLFYQTGAFQGDLINTPSTQNIVFNEQAQRELQQRIWEIVQQWNSGMPIEQILVPAQQDSAQLEGVSVTYDLTINQGSGDGHYALGETIVIVSDPAPDGQRFSHWQGNVDTIQNVNASTTQLTMWEGPMEISAVYEPDFVAVDQGYRFLRFEITAIGGNEQFHLRELQWLDANGQPLIGLLDSNNTAEARLSTSYPANFSFRAFDHDIGTNFYLNASGANSNVLPIQFTLDLNHSVTPFGIAVSYPMWSPNLRGFRCLVSNDGETWDILADYSEINVNDFVSETGAVNSAIFRW